MATEKQIAYITDLLADVTAELDRAERFAAWVETTNDAVDAPITRDRVALMRSAIATLDTDRNTSALISGLQRGVSGLAAYLWRLERGTERGTAFAMVAQRGLGVTPNFK